MLATSNDRLLHEMYHELATLKSRQGLAAQAADLFALAMYYARRMNDPAALEACRRKVLLHNPDSVAGRQASAPLYFAQLLMRYPSDAVSDALQAHRKHVADIAVARVAEIAPPPAAPEMDIVEPPLEQQWPIAAADSPSPPVAPALELHHVLDMAAKPVSAERVVEDFLLAPSLADPSPAARPKRRPLFEAAVNGLAISAILGSLTLLTYIATESYPRLREMNIDRMVGSFLDDPTTGEPAKPLDWHEPPGHQPLPAEAIAVKAPEKKQSEPPKPATEKLATRPWPPLR